MKLLNERVLVINGLPRSGTNILWNIAASHPDAALPQYETGQIVRRIPVLGPASRFGAMHVPFLREQLLKRFDRRAFELKMACMSSPDHRLKSPHRAYERDELERAVLCLKSVEHDMRLNPLIRAHYPRAHFVGIVRNGYAVCEGLMRRGLSARRAARRYRRYARLIIDQARRMERYLLIHFEDLVTDPFAIAARIYSHAGLEPTEVAHLRLKSKSTVSADAAFGTKGCHYWFDRDSITDAIDPYVDASQSQRLTGRQRREIERVAHRELAELGYLDR